MAGEAAEALFDVANAVYHLPALYRDVRDKVTYVRKRFRGSNPEFSTPEPPEGSPPPFMPKRVHNDGPDEETFIGTQAPLFPRTHHPRVAPRLAKAIKECCLSPKLLQDSRTGAAVSAAGETIVCLNDLSQGVSDSTRIADDVQYLDLKINGVAALPGTAATDVYRLTVVLDKECFGNLCTYGQVLYNTTSGTLSYSLFNWQNKDRFVVLFDHAIALTNRSATGASGAGDLKTFNIHLPLRFKTKYNGNAGTIGDIVKNSLCLLQCSQNGAVVVQWASQLEFMGA